MEEKQNQPASGKVRKGKTYVDLLTDSGFKAVFGDENNKELIINFINSVLGQERHVTDVEFLPGEWSGRTVTSKGVRFDLLCHDSQGRKFVVEMQRRSHSDDFYERSVYYAGLAMASQQSRGADNYFYEPVYVIGIMEDALKHEKLLNESALLSRYQMVEITRGIVAPSTINCIFVQLRNFKLRQEECRTEFDRWCFSFKHAAKLEEVPFEDKLSKALFRACEIAQFPNDKQLAYEADMMTERDYRHDLYFEREEGKAEGRAEGRAEGINLGIATVAKTMKQNGGFTVEQIAAATGLSKEQIVAL